MARTVKQLIELLETLPQDHIVLLSKDEEGNGFTAWGGYSTEYAEDPEAWEVELWDEEDAAEEGLEENVVVLWP